MMAQTKGQKLADALLHHGKLRQEIEIILGRKLETPECNRLWSHIAKSTTELDVFSLKDEPTEPSKSKFPYLKY